MKPVSSEPHDEVEVITMYFNAMSSYFRHKGGRSRVPSRLASLPVKSKKRDSSLKGCANVFYGLPVTFAQ